MDVCIAGSYGDFTSVSVFTTKWELIIICFWLYQYMTFVDFSMKKLFFARIHKE